MPNKDTDFNILFKSIPIPTVLITNDGDIVEANISFWKVIHDLTTEKGGVNFYDLFPQLKGKSGAGLKGCQLELQRQKGRFIFMLSVSALKDGTIVSFKDVTNERAQVALFMSFASHELKTPLASIRAFTELLERRNISMLDERSKYFIEKINKKINEQTRLIQDLLDTARIRSGGIELLKEPFNLNLLIKSVIEDVAASNPAYTITKRGMLRKEINADKIRIRQVLNNLLLDAIQHSPSIKKIEVQIQNSQNYASIAIKNWGDSIEKKDLKTIFEPCFQEKKPQKRVGTPGLRAGFYISSEIIKAHKGSINVKSGPGKGSELTVQLPL